MTLVTIDHLSKSYPGVQALKDVSFEIERGQVHALVGENGAGKSTLIQVLAGAVQPDSGQITLDGLPYVPQTPKDALRAGVSTIFQMFNLLPDRSIAFNILLGREIHTRLGFLNIRTIEAEAARMLQQLNSSYLSPKQPVSSLKVGEKQIVEIGKALINQSRLLIMDEPTSALNQAEIEALFGVIRLLRAQSVTILYVSHRLDEIFELADRVTVLRDGTHITTRPIAEVTRDSLVEHMIGRKLSSVFPERGQPTPDVILDVNELTVESVLYDISFKLHRGEVLAVAGLPGSGKTELGKALFGDLRLSRGQLMLKGQPYKPGPKAAIRRQLMYLPEDRKAEGVIQGLPVRRNISLAILPGLTDRIGFLNLRRERELAAQQAAALDIKTPSLDQIVFNLSGGNQQKVALAKCLLIDPDVLILVEPTQGIDVGVKFDIYQFIVDQVAAGRAVLLISSEIPEILGLSHRILVLRDGRIAADLDTAATTQEDIFRYAVGELQQNVSNEKE
jgi:ABC-type sugar transport system ATPase subunit